MTKISAKYRNNFTFTFINANREVKGKYDNEPEHLKYKLELGDLERA